MQVTEIKTIGMYGAGTIGGGFADISDMKATPDTWADQSGEQIIDEMAGFPEVIGHTKPEIASFRDNLIINVLKMHHRM